MLGRLNHVAIAVPDLVSAARQYKNILGARISEPQRLDEHGVTIIFIKLPNSKVELLEPIDKTSPIARFLEKNPKGGMHHICYEVDDIFTAREQLIKGGARVLGNSEPRIGAHGKLVLFINPGDFSGTLIELEQA